MFKPTHQYGSKHRQYRFWMLKLIMMFWMIPIMPAGAGVGLLSGAIPNDGSYHTVNFNVPAGTTHTVVKVALDINADPSNEPDFRVYENVSNMPQSFDNPQDLKTVKFGGGPADNLADVEWYCPPINPDPCAGDQILVFRIDHSIRTAGSVAVDEAWVLEIKNNDTATREFFLGVGHSSTANGTTAIAESTNEAEVPKLKVVSEDPLQFGEVLSGLTVSTGLPDLLDLRIANVGTVSLDLQQFSNETNSAFWHDLGALSTPLPLAPLSHRDLPIRFNPGTSAGLGPITGSITIDYSKPGVTDPASFEPPLTAYLAGTAVQLDLAILVDISSSMGWTPAGSQTTDPDQTRLKQAKLAGQEIQALIENIEGGVVHMGLFTFPKQGDGSASAGEVAELKNELRVNEALFDLAWLDGPGSLQSLGIHGTPMAEGLDLAHGMTPFTNRDWRHGQYVRRGLLMLSDGVHLHDSDPPKLKTAQDWVDFLKTFNNTVDPENPHPDPNTNIRIFTVPYGYAESDHIDRDLMQELASASAGAMYTADVDNTAALAKGFMRAAIDWAGWAGIEDPEGSLVKGMAQQTHNVCIDDDTTRVAFVVNWDKVANSAIDFVLEGPDGTVLPSSPDVSFLTSQNYAMYIVKGETAKGHEGSDQWTLKLTGGQGLSTGETVQYSYSVTGKSRVKMSTQSTSQPFYTLGKQLIEIIIDVLPGEQMARANIRLEYDIPNESYGTWLSSMEAFDTQWLVQPHVGTTPRTKTEDKVGLSNPVSDAVADESTQILYAPTVIMGEPASMVQRKAYALANFAKRPFHNLRSTGELKLVDNGTNGDKQAGDGIYSAYLPAMAHDGLAKYRAYLSIDSDNDCLNRELRIDKLIRVALDSAIMAKNVLFRDAAVSPFFSPDLNKEILTPIPKGSQRRNIVFTPKDQAGNYWGPGKVGQVKFNVEGASTIGSAVDNLDGSYSLIIQYQSDATPTVAVSVGGVTTEDIEVKDKPEIVSWWLWLLLILLVLSLIVWFIRRQNQNP